MLLPDRLVDSAKKLSARADSISTNIRETSSACVVRSESRPQIDLTPATGMRYTRFPILSIAPTPSFIRIISYRSPGSVTPIAFIIDRFASLCSGAFRHPRPHPTPDKFDHGGRTVGGWCDCERTGKQCPALAEAEWL